MLQHRPPEIRANTEIYPVVKEPTSMAIAARIERVNNVFTGFSWPKKKAAMATAIQIK
jgi:hypothetical protein